MLNLFRQRYKALQFWSYELKSVKNTVFVKVWESFA